MTMIAPAHPVRLNAGSAAPDVYRAYVAFNAAAGEALEPALRELVRTRASQRNGCAYCLDMHVPDARAAGIDERRLTTLAAWRESPFFDARERAALALTDAVTTLGEDGVSDAVWDEAAARFAEPELTALLWTIIAINGWNRLAVATRMVPSA